MKLFHLTLMVYENRLTIVNFQDYLGLLGSLMCMCDLSIILIILLSPSIIHSTVDERNYFYVDKKGNIFFDPTMNQGVSQSRFAGTSIASKLQTGMNKLQERPREYTVVDATAVFPNMTSLSN